MIEPPWVIEARKHLGLREIPGAQTAPTIARWLADLKAWWRDDETPWCGVAVAAWMKACGVPLPKHWYRAKGWLDWGTPVSTFAPVYGSVAVFSRDGGGHVGLLVGKDALGRWLVLGGNQGNAVSIVAFEPDRCIGLRMPSSMPYSQPLPLIRHTWQNSGALA